MDAHAVMDHHAGETRGTTSVAGSRTPAAAGHPASRPAARPVVPLPEAAAGRDEPAARRLRAVLDASPNSILLVDADGRILFANEQVHATFGYRPEALAGQLVELLVPDAARTAHVGRREGFVRWGGRRRDLGVRTNLAGRRIDGSTFPADIALGRIELDEGPGVVVTVIDTEARHRLEAQLLQAQKMELMGRFANMLAHDIRNYLSAIGGLADLALDSDGCASPHEEMAMIREVVDRADDAIANILGIGRRRDAGIPGTDIATFLNANLRVFEHLARPGCSILADAPRDLPAVAIAPAALSQILMNLVTNARDSMPAGGPIVIGAALEPAPDDHLPPARRSVRVFVRDAGIGMDEATRARIFEPFFSTKATDDASGSGSGLGLASVELLVSRARGRIRVRSAPGEGTLFEVILPALDGAPARRPDADGDADGDAAGADARP